MGADNPIMKDEIMQLRPERLGVEEFIRLTRAALNRRETADSGDTRE